MDKNIWLKEPEVHDFPAALDFLELLFDKAQSKALTGKLKKTSTILKKAKDILRASSLPLLPEKNMHVQVDLKRVRKGKKLSPVLLVTHENKLIIADGYHRVCALYYLSEDDEIPCRLISTKNTN
jgi:hypothetical protein